MQTHTTNLSKTSTSIGRTQKGASKALAAFTAAQADNRTKATPQDLNRLRSFVTSDGVFLLTLLPSNPTLQDVKGAKAMLSNPIAKPTGKVTLNVNEKGQKAFATGKGVSFGEKIEGREATHYRADGSWATRVTCNPDTKKEANSVAKRPSRKKATPATPVNEFGPIRNIGHGAQALVASFVKAIY
jgi:hypothetical protein